MGMRLAAHHLRLGGSLAQVRVVCGKRRREFLCGRRLQDAVAFLGPCRKKTLLNRLLLGTPAADSVQIRCSVHALAGWTSSIRGCIVEG